MVSKCTDEMGAVVWIWGEWGIGKVVRATCNVSSVTYNALLESLEEIWQQ